jgi:hypothetical protein
MEQKGTQRNRKEQLFCPFLFLSQPGKPNAGPAMEEDAIVLETKTKGLMAPALTSFMCGPFHFELLPRAKEITLTT